MHSNTSLRILYMHIKYYIHPFYSACYIVEWGGDIGGDRDSKHNIENGMLHDWLHDYFLLLLFLFLVHLGSSS